MDKQKTYGLLAIGVSTGGPNALMQIFKELRRVKVPIVIVQHIAGNFPTMLVDSLNRISHIPFTVAREGESLLPNRAYVSNSGAHMTVKKKECGGYEIHYLDSPPVKSCRPSVDVLFTSLAKTIEEKMLVLVLTGMGNDGSDGVAEIKKANKKHIVVCQDQESSVVYGMNRAVIEAKLADKVMPIERLPNYLTSLIGEL